MSAFRAIHAGGKCAPASARLDRLGRRQGVICGVEVSPQPARRCRDSRVDDGLDGPDTHRCAAGPEPADGSKYELTLGLDAVLLDQPDDDTTGDRDLIELTERVRAGQRRPRAGEVVDDTVEVHPLADAIWDIDQWGGRPRHVK